MPTLDQLRRLAVARTLFAPTTLARAIERLRFVQADPIRAPAAAQDLILRHRVRGYRAGDLERRYGSLGVEEDYFYAYGFMTRDLRRLLHPRTPGPLSALESRVLALVSRLGATHPGDLDRHFPRRRVVNGWGGRSMATTAALDALHYRGLLRVAGRRNGIRVYERETPVEPRPPEERLRRLILHVAHVLSPVALRTLRATVARFRRLGRPPATVAELVRRGELRTETVDGEPYAWPEARTADGIPDEVRFLAPFDPLVWDRRRFEHFWGWRYRFEAYTPAAKRTRGYYAMPLLWRERIVGWANARAEGGRLDVSVGYAGPRPRDAAFRSALEAEVERLRGFLHDGTMRPA